MISNIRIIIYYIHSYQYINEMKRTISIILIDKIYHLK